MYKFIKTRNPENRFDNTEVKITVEAESLEEMLEAFHDFLFACSFRPKGELEFVEEIDETATNI